MKVKTPAGELLLKPGHWLTFSIRGKQKIEVQEHGDYVVVESPIAPLTAPAPLKPKD